MKVSDVMTHNVRFIEPGTTLMEAAMKMREMGCGFLPISNEESSRLEGVVTDRDIVTRAVAEGMDPTATTVHQIRTEAVLYCFADDDLEVAMDSMRTQKVYRLIVLNNPGEKRLCGVLSLGDAYRYNEKQLASEAARSIEERAA